MTSYPEKIPTSADVPIRNFYFRLDAAKGVKKQLQSELSHIDERIDKIVDHFTLSDMPSRRTCGNSKSSIARGSLLCAYMIFSLPRCLMTSRTNGLL